MRLDGLGAEEQLGGDLGVGPAVDDQARHLQLALGERGDVAGAGGTRACAAVATVAQPAQLAFGLGAARSSPG